MKQRFIVSHKQCQNVYIGESGRTLKVRMAEHKRAVKSKDPLNGITVHVQKTAHNINWQEARILARENNWGRRRVLEALETQQRRPKMNLDAGLYTSGSIMDPLCSSEERKSRDQKCLGGEAQTLFKEGNSQGIIVITNESVQNVYACHHCHC